MTPLDVGAPMPPSIGLCADLYHDVRDMRLAMDKEAAAIKARETEIREYIVANLSRSADTGAAGQRYRAQIVVKRKFTIADWGVLTAWVRKNDRFDLLQKRLSDTAAADFEQEQGRPVPGTEGLNVPDVSVTKI